MRYPVVCFDLDGTLVDETIYIWSTLHRHFRTDQGARDRARHDFYAGRITYREWFETDLRLLSAAGADRPSIVELIGSLPVMPGARETLAALRAQGRRIAVISGSIDLVVSTLFPDERFDHLLINRLAFDSKGRIVGGESTRYDLDRKADGLLEVARLEGISPSEVAFVGDNSNDVAIARTAGLAIAFNCKSEELRQACRVEVTAHDLRAILPHLD